MRSSLKKKEEVPELSVPNNVDRLSFMGVRFCLAQRETNAYLVTGNDKPDNLVNGTLSGEKGVHRMELVAAAVAANCDASCLKDGSWLTHLCSSTSLR